MCCRSCVGGGSTSSLQHQREVLVELIHVMDFRTARLPFSLFILLVFYILSSCRSFHDHLSLVSLSLALTYSMVFGISWISSKVLDSVIFLIMISTALTSKVGLKD